MSVVDEYAPPPPVAAPRRSPLVGVLAGLGAAVAGSLVWLGLTMLLGIRVGLVGVAIGIAVAWVMRRTGAAGTKAFGAIAALLAVFGCALGHLLEEYANLADYTGLGLFTTMGRAPLRLMRELWLKDSSFITWLIFGFAAYTAFRGAAEPARAAAPSSPPPSYPPPPPPPPAP